MPGFRLPPWFKPPAGKRDPNADAERAAEEAKRELAKAKAEADKARKEHERARKELEDAYWELQRLSAEIDASIVGCRDIEEWKKRRNKAIEDAERARQRFLDAQRREEEARKRKNEAERKEREAQQKAEAADITVHEEVSPSPNPGWKRVNVTWKDASGRVVYSAVFIEAPNGKRFEFGLDGTI